MRKQVVGIFKALADETRMEILRRLLEKKEIACKELLLQFSLSQPALSHHFNKLIDANLLRERKEGVNHFYSINNQYLKNIGIDIRKVVYYETK